MIYLVFAQAGSRSNEDADDWIVCAYASLALAEHHAAKAQQRADRLYRANSMWTVLRMDTSREKTTWLDHWGCPRDGANPYDPGMRFNNDVRVGYSVLAIPLRSAVGKIEIINPEG